MSLNTTPPLDGPRATARRIAFAARWRDGLLRPGRRWVLISAAMYATACLLPAVRILGQFSGWECLASMAYGYPPWWANPTYFVAVIASLLNRTRIAVVFAFVAALLATSFELERIYDQGKGIQATMNDLQPGCLMWIASLQLLACHELWRQWLEWRRRQECLERGPDKLADVSPVQSSTRQ